jgi:hypothetical protein
MGKGAIACHWRFHLKVKDVKTIKELSKLTEKTLGKKKKINEMVKKKKKECGTRNQFYGS